MTPNSIDQLINTADELLFQNTQRNLDYRDND